MSKWCELELGQAMRVKHGWAFKGEHFRDRGEQIVLTPGNFIDRGGFKPKNGVEKFYDGSYPSQFLLRRGDVVTAMTEQAKGLLGSTATIPLNETYLHNQRIGLIEITDPEMLDLRFVYHLMNAPAVRRQLQATATGSKVRHTAPERIQAVRVEVPDISAQRVIAEVLDAIDALVENNRRRVDVLEEMARATYREWFVNFRYPGHEDVPLVNSALGPIPEGWKPASVGEIAVVDKGLSYKGVHLTDVGVPMANLKCIAPRGGFRRNGVKPYSGPYKPRHSVAPGDLVLANTDLTQSGTVIGSPALIPRRGFAQGGLLSHHLFAVRPVEEKLTHLLYQEFAGPTFRAFARGVASGTTVLGFRPADLLSYRLAMPADVVLDQYADLADSLYRMGEELLDAAESLESLRNRLLPKLVTGQIDVSTLDFDAQVEGAVA